MTGSNKKVKAAVVQAAPAFMDLEGCVAKATQLIQSAASQGVDIIGFPETWIPGYPSWAWLSATAMNVKYFQDYHQNSLVRFGDAFNEIATVAHKNSVFVSMGASERNHGSLYISQFLFDRNGEAISCRRKLKPTHMERTIFGDGDGSDLQVVDTEIGLVGQLSCWEHLQPLSKYAMYSMHEQIHVAAWPTFSLYPQAYALGPQLNNAASQLYAAEGQCFVLAPCGVVSQDMIDFMVENEAQASLLQAGGGYAQIFGPDGRPLCESLPERDEGLLIADLDLGEIAIAKSFADPVGHYSRPDVTRLLYNANPQPCVEAGALDLQPSPEEEEATVNES